MCGTCGCGSETKVSLITDIRNNDHSHNHEVEHHHTHPHDHHHHHHHHEHPHTHAHVHLEEDILRQNQLLAERNRGYFMAKKMLVFNMISSPGSGKTSILEKMLQDLGEELKCYVIEGDQQTTHDAERIKATGTEVVQVNTGKGCHLESHTIQEAVSKLDPEEKSLLFIENVGNLVCPAMFDLGEQIRIVIMSVTEGTDKPIKYPDAFYGAQICLINKIDLLPYVDFDVAQAKDYALRVNPKLQFFEVSATKGDGMQEWYQWIKSQIQ
jgi:hydrogenase nickel incorporation protein HypB